VDETEAAIGNWLYNYNYKSTHQGIGGLVVPAERFHGQADQVLAAVAKGIDVSTDYCYSFCGTDRSMINLALSPDGKLYSIIFKNNVSISYLNSSLVKKNDLIKFIRDELPDELVIKPTSGWKGIALNIYTKTKFGIKDAFGDLKTEQEII
jgi:hypothetical protein